MHYRLLGLGALVLAALLQSALPAAAQSQPSPTATATPDVPIPPALPPIVKYERYISAGYLVPPIVCNEFSPCNKGSRYRSSAVRAAFEFPISGISLTGMVKVDIRHYGYPHNGVGGPVLACLPGSSDPSCVGVIGNTGATSVGAFQPGETDFDIRAGVRAFEPRLYLAVSYLQRTNTYGYPRLTGLGIGLEKLPDVDQIFSAYGGLYYYPTVRGDYAVGSGPLSATNIDLAYHVLRYDMGITLKPSMHSPLFLDAGYLGDRSRNANNAPSNITRNGPFVGVGLSF
ncbi:MAG: hypothetical protein NVSMB31_07640 [Vulcanimicrobiaceae bacterium]